MRHGRQQEAEEEKQLEEVVEGNGGFEKTIRQNREEEEKGETDD